MRKKKILIVRKSCLTGKDVWVYHGTSKGSAKVVYHRACKEELRRMSLWKKQEERRKQDVLALLNECLAQIPEADGLTAKQAKAVKRLKAVANEEIPCDKEFYRHVIAERIRRKNAKVLIQERKLREEQTCLTIKNNKNENI